MASALAGGCALRLPRLRLRGQPRAGLRRACRRSGCRRWSPPARSPSLLAWLSPPGWPARLGAAALAGARARRRLRLVWPHCLGRLERSSPELERLWLTRCARRCRSGGTASATAGADRDPAGRRPDRLCADALAPPPRSGAAASPGRRSRCPPLLAAALLCWQTRAGPAAQLLSIPGATALAWIVDRLAHGPADRCSCASPASSPPSCIVSGLATGYVTQLFPQPVSAIPAGGQHRQQPLPDPRARWRPVARQPRGMVLTFVDLGPRLITVTPHNAIAGPYHRNAAADHRRDARLARRRRQCPRDGRSATGSTMC